MALHSYLSLFPVVKILKSDIKLDSGGFDFLGSTAASLTAASAHSEQVKDVVEALCLGSIAETLLTVLVVGLSLLRVTQHLVGHCYLFEL